MPKGAAVLYDNWAKMSINWWQFNVFSLIKVLIFLITNHHHPSSFLIPLVKLKLVGITKEQFWTFEVSQSGNFKCETHVQQEASQPVKYRRFKKKKFAQTKVENGMCFSFEIVENFN